MSPVSEHSLAEYMFLYIGRYNTLYHSDIFAECLGGIINSIFVCSSYIIILSGSVIIRSEQYFVQWREDIILFLYFENIPGWGIAQNTLAF